MFVLGLLVGMKQALSNDSLSQVLDLANIRSHTWKIMPCSAVTGANLVEGLDWIVSDVAKRLYYSTTVTPLGLAPRIGEPSSDTSLINAEPITIA
jgi:ADP-ribosylation factor-like protein 2